MTCEIKLINQVKREIIHAHRVIMLRIDNLIRSWTMLIKKIIKKIDFISPVLIN